MEFSKTTIVGLAAAVVLGGGLWYSHFSSGVSPDANMSPVAESASPALAPSDETATDDTMTQGAAKEFTIVADNFSFSPDTITVKRGDTVRITVKNANGVHDWKLDAFNASTGRLQTGEEQTIEFVASETGQFEYYCSIGSHRAMGMKGTLVVE